MAGEEKRVDQLDEATSLDDADRLLVQVIGSGETRQIRVDNARDALGGIDLTAIPGPVTIVSDISGGAPDGLHVTVDAGPGMSADTHYSVMGVEGDPTIGAVSMTVREGAEGEEGGITQIIGGPSTNVSPPTANSGMAQVKGGLAKNTAPGATIRGGQVVIEGGRAQDESASPGGTALGGDVEINGGFASTVAGESHYGSIQIGRSNTRQIESDSPWVHRDTFQALGVVESDAGTARTLSSNTDKGKTVVFTAATPILVTVPFLQVGTTVELVQGGSGQVQLVADAGVNLRYPSAFLPNSNEQWSTMVVTMISSTEALVRGDLEAAP